MKQIYINDHTKKHVSIVTLILSVSLIAFLGICVYLAVKPAQFARGQSVSRGHITPNRALISHDTLSYPVFHIEKVDALLKSYVTKQRDVFWTAQQKARDVSGKIAIDYKVLHSGLRTVTVEFDQHEQTASSQSLTSKKMISIDTQTQKELTLQDIFASQNEAQSFLGTMLRDYFTQHQAGVFSSKELADMVALDLQNIKDFYLGDDTLTLWINPHRMAEQKDLKTITIRKQLISGILKNDYIADDPGLNDDMPVVPDYSINEMPRRAVVINPHQKMLALTFDDGPGNYTASLLDTLKQSGARATFFVIGRQVAGYAAVERRVIDEGNEIGNHSWSHPNLTRVPIGQLQQQVIDTQNAVRSATGGYIPTHMRPPEGAVNPAVGAFLQQHNLRMSLWNVDTQDWMYRNAQIVYDRIMAGAGDGNVILLHDIHPTSVEAAKRAIPDLIAQGYQLVTMTELERYR